MSPHLAITTTLRGSGYHYGDLRGDQFIIPMLFCAVEPTEEAPIYLAIYPLEPRSIYGIILSIYPTYPMDNQGPISICAENLPMS